MVMASDTSGWPSGTNATTRRSPPALEKRAWLEVIVPGLPMAPLPCTHPVGTAMLNLSSASVYKVVVAVDEGSLASANAGWGDAAAASSAPAAAGASSDRDSSRRRGRLLPAGSSACGGGARGCSAAAEAVGCWRRPAARARRAGGGQHHRPRACGGDRLGGCAPAAVLLVAADCRKDMDMVALIVGTAAPVCAIYALISDE